MTTLDTPLSSNEYAPAFAGYLSRFPEGPVLEALQSQIDLFVSLTRNLGEVKETYAYAEGKWSVREVLGHLVDTERVMGYRALAIARGETGSLPGFDEDLYAANAPWKDIPLLTIAEEFKGLRWSHVIFFRNLTAEAAVRIGTANGNPASPRALGRILVGHMRHHFAVLDERYGVRPL